MFSALASAIVLFAASSIPASAKVDGQTPTAQKPAASKCEWRYPPGPRAMPVRVCKKPGDELTGIGGPECDPAYKGTTGHYVWVAPRQYGPRAPLKPPVRVWMDGMEAC